MRQSILTEIYPYYCNGSKGGIIMARPRKQTYTLEMYLDKIEDKDICNNADVQRHFVWSNEQINELVVTVLTDEYMPPIILGEEKDSQLRIADGGQRTSALNKFRHGNYKITASVADSRIPYKKKIKDKKGNIAWEDAVFDIKNKTYEKLPEELKKKFNEYQIETVIHENCDPHKISRYIKRYNNHTPMNTDQKAFLYIDRFAGEIREMLDTRFFLDCSDYSEADKTKGVVERVIVETVMCTNHLDKWKKQPRELCKYLNSYATKEEFSRLADNLRRLERIVTKDIRSAFNKKDSFIFLTLFDRFTKTGREDEVFADFLKAFQGSLRHTRSNDDGLLFDEIDKEKSTKDKLVILAKLNMLEGLMQEFLDVQKEGGIQDDEKAFLSEMIGIDTDTLEKDMELYHETLDDLEQIAIRIGSRLRDRQNRLSLLAMVAFSYKEDKDLDEWMKEYARKNMTYFVDQRKNYLYMKNDFEKYSAAVSTLKRKKIVKK